jgi:ATP-dependent exoDNAse (exonuclease V) beta subunit
VPRTQAGKERQHWAGSKAKALDRLARQAWIDLLEVGLLEKILAEEAEYDRAPIEAEHRAMFRPILERALHALTSRLAAQNAASRALLERYETSYRALSRDRGLLRFEDLPDALAPASGADPLAARGVDLAHRLDGRIDHLLLDEFQDTAPVQWRVLRALADSIAADESGERSFFCVGDEKQSIYGWRAAEPRLLRDLHRKRPALARKSLEKSYRSSRAVLGAVNLVFGTIAQNPAFEGEDEETIAAAEEFQAAFVEHAPNAERPGAVHLVRSRVPREEEPEHVPVLAASVDRVKAILDAAPRASVGVLLRRRAWIPDLIRRLRDRGIGASDEGGNPLTDSVAVLHALSLLHLADHPGDTAAAFHVATSPFGERVGIERALFEADGRPDAAAHARIGEAARAVRAALAVRGYGGFLASIRPGAGYGGWDLDRYDQLVDLALAWEDRAGSRPGAFVAHVRRRRSRTAARRRCA